MMPLSTHGATRSFPMNLSDALRHLLPLPASLCAAAVLASATALGQSSGATHHAATSHLVPRRERERPLHVLVGDGSGNFPGGAGLVQIRRASDGALLTEIHGPVNVEFGVAVAGLVALAAVGDLDGDGVLDLAIGATQDNNAGPGYVAVYSGAR